MPAGVALASDRLLTSLPTAPIDGGRESVTYSYIVTREDLAPAGHRMILTG
jgi:hypothetical protein